MNRSVEIHEGLQGVWSRLGPFDRTALLPGRRHLHLVVDELDIDQVRKALPADGLEGIEAPFAGVEVTLSDSRTGEADVGVLAHVVGVLVHKGIEVREVLTSTPESIVLVPGNQAVEAYELACQFVDGGESSDEGAA
jgi:hypothetical protein